MESKKFCQFLLPALKGNEAILDIGCGGGYLCNCLAQKLKKSVVGLDVSNKGFDKAHNLCKKFNTCNLIECFQGKAENMTAILKGRKFDVTIFIHSFHHIKNFQKALLQSKKVLNKNGRVIIAEYSPEYGKKKDNCKRFSVGFITSLLVENFKTVSIRQSRKGFFIFTAYDSQIF